MTDLPNWAPQVTHVGTRLLSRTRLPNGDTAGTFNAETKPTGSQVQEVITQAVNLMTPRLGPVADSMVGQAQALAAIRVAYMIELAYFAEQIEAGISPYNTLRAEYKDELSNWDEAAKGLEPNSPSAVHSIRVATEYPGVQ